jgi:hypothetical protein
VIFQYADLAKYPEHSPEWNLAVIQLLLEMKGKGHKINEFEHTGVSKYVIQTA